MNLTELPTHVLQDMLNATVASAPKSEGTRQLIAEFARRTREEENMATNSLEYEHNKREQEDARRIPINLRSDERLTHAQILRHFALTGELDEDTKYKILDAVSQGAEALEQRHHFIQHADIKPGDTIVLSFAYQLPNYAYEEIHKEIEASIPGCTVLILSNGGRIDSILRATPEPSTST